MSKYSDSHSHKCKFCGKLVHWKHRRACCEECSPWGEAVWVEFYGGSDWVSHSRCLEEKMCGVEWEPNGGFVCAECYVAARDSKHTLNLV